jgi:hypothetical protein
MSSAFGVAIKLIGMFLLAALGAELAAGIVNGGGMGNSTILIITEVINTVINGVVALIVNIPIVLLNFVIAILNGLLGLSIPSLPYIVL